MITTREGEWFVCTPVYIGSPNDLELMKVCNHGPWVESSKQTANNQLIVLERCRCGASRVKYKPKGND